MIIKNKSYHIKLIIYVDKIMMIKILCIGKAFTVLASWFGQD